MKTVPCPRCGTLAPYAPENRWRPFCSERCRVIDLGNWAAEAYRVPVSALAAPDAVDAANDTPTHTEPGKR